MKELNNKIKNWYQSLTSKKISFERSGIKPRNDWAVIVFSTFIIIVFLVSVSIYFYIKISNGTLFKVPEKEQIGEIRINKKLLDEFVQDFDSKESALIELDEGRPIPPNPSL